MLPYKEQLTAYFKKELIEFNLPIHVKGTAFQLAVWDALKELPYGTTTTYGNIAQRIGNPKAVRAVGTAIEQTQSWQLFHVIGLLAKMVN